jgi:hypothetical protein
MNPKQSAFAQIFQKEAIDVSLPATRGDEHEYLFQLIEFTRDSLDKQWSAKFSTTDDKIDALSKEVKLLRSEIRRLKKYAPQQEEYTESDRIYEHFKAELEEKYYGKVVAIDDDLGRIVGIGDTLSDAYEAAKEATRKKQFDFKRVGYRYLNRI